MENDKIRVLPDGVANQIAAGEVVGRPASVVKELMENAVDAGSTVVTVNYRDGGKSLIQVVDNGCGMSDTDARLAFERHATSKIRSADDLYRLHSFGFRGEALPSIASVAEVELRTRTPYGELGTKVCIHGGRFQSQEPVQMPQGTQFSVKNLFYNTPARRRFLKEASVEARHIRTEFQRVALCNPGIAFTLCDGDAPLVQLPATNLRQRIVSAVGGREIAKNLLEVSVDTSMVRVEGFVGRPSAAKKTNREQFLFVNGRYFQSSYFRKAVLQAYDKLIPSDTQPSYFLYITIDPERIDVNVHPQKTEIRFDDEQALWQIFNAAVREALGKTGVVPLMDFEIDPSIDIPVARKGVIYREPDLGVDPSFNPFDEERKTSGAGRPFPAYGRRARVRIRGERLEQLYEVDSQAIFPTDKSGETGADRLVEFDSDELEYIEGGGSGAAQAAFDWEAEPVTGEVLMLGGRYCATRLREGLAVVDLPRAWERVRYERYLGMSGNEDLGDPAAAVRRDGSAFRRRSVHRTRDSRGSGGRRVRFPDRGGIHDGDGHSGRPAGRRCRAGRSRNAFRIPRKRAFVARRPDSAHGGRDGALRSHDLPRCDGRRCGSGAFARMAPLRRIQLYARRPAGDDGADRRRIG